MKIKKHHFLIALLLSSVHPDLIHYWPISPDTTLDTIGNKHMQTQHPNVTFTSDRFNKPRSALLFNNGHATLPSGIYFDPNTGGFTLMLWLKLLSLANPWHCILTFGNMRKESTENRLSFCFAKHTSILHIMSTHPDHREPCIYLPFKGVPLNKWTHVTVSSSLNGVPRVYLNGELMRVHADPGARQPFDYQNTTRTNNIVGRFNGRNGTELHGVVDDLKIFDVELEADEIRVEADREGYYTDENEEELAKGKIGSEMPKLVDTTNMVIVAFIFVSDSLKKYKKFRSIIISSETWLLFYKGLCIYERIQLLDYF